MAEFLISLAVFVVAVLAMSVGVLCGRKAIKGSCGGLNAIPGLRGACGACSQPCQRRQRRDGGVPAGRRDVVAATQRSHRPY